MSSNDDVKLNDVDYLASYNSKFGNFHALIISQLLQFQNLLQEKQEEIRQMVNVVEDIFEQIDHERSRAGRQKEEALRRWSQGL